MERDDVRCAVHGAQPDHCGVFYSLLCLQHTESKLATALQVSDQECVGTWTVDNKSIGGQLHLTTVSVNTERMALIHMHVAAASRMFEEQQMIETFDLNPLDVDAQAKSADRIRLSNVQNSMEIAIEVCLRHLRVSRCCTYRAH